MDVKFLVTQERIERQITIKQFRLMRQNDIDTIVLVLSKFILDGDGYMEEKKAFDLLDNMTIEELKKAFSTFNAQQTDAVISPMSAASSNLP
jgi:hypothetical protein